MHRRHLFSAFALILISVFLSPTLPAQSAVCEAGNGPLDPAKPAVTIRVH
jgi:hypothetical protein